HDRHERGVRAEGRHRHGGEQAGDARVRAAGGCPAVRESGRQDQGRHADRGVHRTGVVTGAPERGLRVHELTVLIARQLMEGDTFKDLWIEGEVSEMRAVEGNVYFTLRDNTSQIRCSLFAMAAASVALTPRVGARLLVHGELSVYIKGGSYSLRCDDVRAAGAGDA